MQRKYCLRMVLENNNMFGIATIWYFWHRCEVNGYSIPNIWRDLHVFELSCTTASILLGCFFLYRGRCGPELQLLVYMLVCWRQSSKRFVLGARNLQFPDILFHPQRELRFNAFTSYITSRHWVTNCRSLLLYTQGDPFKIISPDTFSLSIWIRMNHPVLPHLLFLEWP